jgi:hypothetical protein
MSESDVFRGYGVPVSLPDDDAFLKVRETLQRIGVASRKEKVLYQSAHILHKQGKYAILHFKELFALDGKPTDFTEDDRSRRNAITSLLEEWDLIKILDKSKAEPKAPMNHIKVLTFKEKNEWQLKAKYSVGRKVR